MYTFFGTLGTHTHTLTYIYIHIHIADTQRDVHGKELIRHNGIFIFLFKFNFFISPNKKNDLVITVQTNTTALLNWSYYPIGIISNMPGFIFNDNGVRTLITRLSSFKLPVETKKRKILIIKKMLQWHQVNTLQWSVMNRMSKSPKC